MKLDVLLAVPEKYQADLDLEAIRAVFPYGQIRFQIQVGGMVATSGVAIAELEIRMKIWWLSVSQSQLDIKSGL
jgi:uncharacterized protein (TIGR02058 family)